LKQPIAIVVANPVELEITFQNLSIVFCLFVCFFKILVIETMYMTFTNIKLNSSWNNNLFSVYPLC